VGHASEVSTATPNQLVRVRLQKQQEFALPLCPGSNIHYTLTLTNESDPDTGLLPASIRDPIPTEKPMV